jgi:hypothetical protein
MPLILGGLATKPHCSRKKSDICATTQRARSEAMLPGLPRLPIELLVTASDVLIAAVDVMAGRKRRGFETTVFVRAPREAIWRFLTADRGVFDGPPAMEWVDEPLAGSDGLRLARVSVEGRQIAQAVQRLVRQDAAEGVLILEIVPHELTLPPLPSTDHCSSTAIKEVPGGTALTIRHEMTFTSFRERIRLPFAVRQTAARLKRQLEKEARTQTG